MAVEIYRCHVLDIRNCCQRVFGTKKQPFMFLFCFLKKKMSCEMFIVQSNVRDTVMHQNQTESFKIESYQRQFIVSKYNLIPAIQETDCGSFFNSKDCVGQRRGEGRNCPFLAQYPSICWYFRIFSSHMCNQHKCAQKDA